MARRCVQDPTVNGTVWSLIICLPPLRTSQDICHRIGSINSVEGQKRWGFHHVYIRSGPPSKNARRCPVGTRNTLSERQPSPLPLPHRYPPPQRAFHEESCLERRPRVSSNVSICRNLQYASTPGPVAARVLAGCSSRRRRPRLVLVSSSSRPRPRALSRYSAIPKSAAQHHSPARSRWSACVSGTLCTRSRHRTGRPQSHPRRSCSGP